MIANSVLDFAAPYNVMVGFWAGVAIAFDQKGNYQKSTASHVAIFWKKPNVIHFRQDAEDLARLFDEHDFAAAATRLIRLEFDLKVSGKYAKGGSSSVTVTGTQTISDIYHFHLQSTLGDHWYNSQHCVNPNERHIMGPYVDNHGQTAAIIAQTFKRISYDIPTRYDRELATSP